jgi:hypothetical protein
LAATAIDMFRSPELLQQAKEEFQKRLGDQKYESLMQPNQKPPLDYRNAPKS